MVTTLGSQGDRGTSRTMVWRAPTLKQEMNFDMNFLSASVPSAVVEM